MEHSMEQMIQCHLKEAMAKIDYREVLLQRHLLTRLKSEKYKSSTRAQQFRQDGNQLYATCQTIKDPEQRKIAYARVYACYAQSIAYSQANFQELPLAYGNLSLILLKLGQYSESLQAVDSCLSSGYPDQSKLKIYLRKIECLKTLDEPLKAKRAYVEANVWIERNQTEEEQKIKLKKELDDCYKKQVEVKKKVTQEEVDQVWRKFSIKSFNEEIPAASSAISLNYNESQGRHFVATRDIRPGEILLKERLFALVWSGGSRYNCCWECFQASTNCIPCDCCVNVIFCSVECKETAWREYHQHECKLMHIYIRIPEKEIEWFIVPVRIFLYAINEYGTFEKLKKAVNEMDKLDVDPRTAGFTGEQLMSDKYRGFYSLKLNLISMDLFAPIASKIVYFIAAKTKLLENIYEPASGQIHDDVIFTARLMLKHLMIQKSNAFSESAFNSTSHSGTSLSVAGSWFNHNCFANALYSSQKSYVKAIATRPIKKGEQIFINYLEGQGSLKDKEERQLYLKGAFDFTCECAACTNDWPLEKLDLDFSGSKILLKQGLTNLASFCIHLSIMPK